MLHTKQGKSDDDIQAMKDDADDALRTSNPTLVECWFDQDVLLEAALDLADKQVHAAGRGATRAARLRRMSRRPRDAFDATESASADVTGRYRHRQRQHVSAYARGRRDVPLPQQSQRAARRHAGARSCSGRCPTRSRPS